MEQEFYKLYPYEVPDWAGHLHNKPTHFVKLSNLNTPLHRWNLPRLPSGYEVSIKRDDLTGTELSGSKIRVHQILFAEALREGARHVVTGSGAESCQVRSVALICRTLGLQPHVVIELADNTQTFGSHGNTLLYRMAGSKIYTVPIEGDDSNNKRHRKIKQYISEKFGEKCYCFPVGGFSLKGVYGPISLFEELIHQGMLDRFDDVVVTVGTGTTALGLAVGNYLTGSKLKIHAVTISLSKKEIHDNMDTLLKGLGIASIKSADILDIIEGYIGERYSTCTEQVLSFITEVCSTTGIILDPYYTGKGAMGMVEELLANPSRFKGKRILFIHTGGIFTLFTGEMDRIINEEGAVTNNITNWPDENQSPLN